MRRSVKLKLTPMQVLTILAFVGLLAAYFTVLLAPVAHLTQVSADAVSAIYIITTSIALLAMYVDKVRLQEVSAHASSGRAEKGGGKGTHRKRAGKG